MAIALLTMAPPWCVYLLIQVACLIAADEFYRITLGSEWCRERVAGMGAIACTVAAAWWCPEFLAETLMGVMPLLLVVSLSSGDEVEKMGPRAMASLAGAYYIGLSFAALTRIAAEQSPEGPLLLLALFAAVFAGDTGAYFSGKFLGNRKLYPKISPKKTWAGAYGGAMASALGFWLVDTLAGLGFGAVHSLLLGLGAGISGQVGDLAESLFKRAWGVKDSGTLLPGHGGLLDRVDGLLFGAPFMWLMLVGAGL
jgi:phosphatidate cytidylyltransferase